MVRTNSQPLYRSKMWFPLLLSYSPTRPRAAAGTPPQRRVEDAPPYHRPHGRTRPPDAPLSFRRFKGAERGAGERGEARAG